MVGLKPEVAIQTNESAPNFIGYLNHPMRIIPHKCGKVCICVCLPIHLVFLSLREDIAMPVRMTVLLDQEMDARFTAYCEDRGFKKSTLTARLIRAHLERECSAPNLRHPSKPRSKSGD